MFFTPSTMFLYKSGRTIKLATKMGVIFDLNQIKAKSKTDMVGLDFKIFSGADKKSSMFLFKPEAIPKRKAIKESIVNVIKILIRVLKIKT